MRNPGAYLYITAERREWLHDVVNMSSVAKAKLAIRSSELRGEPLTTDECEYMIPYVWPHQTALRKHLEAKARKAFRESVRGEEPNQTVAVILAAGGPGLSTEKNNYSTLRRALYLAEDPAVCERIRAEIKARFPWGSLK